MTDSIHMPFLARTLHVCDSTDRTLLGLSGTVVNESRHMIALDVGGQTKNLAKNVIKFTLDDEDDQIEGAMVCQRPEDRIHRNYRRN
ncbi:MAG: ribonuclease P protein subunit [Candidatus Thalassarchaeaceae archaeon]|nr:ribonuclease P protein subunit [Candidatus Thalassarchaeaceae archaeon]